ncbi:C6 transcription factor [Colletotrichum tabaci]|uniref:C6 transcription factor n=1 Tax=Colletotrichum tabaci TaxID=1209068 RepID=A0AAV9TC31_9PEZI
MSGVSFELLGHYISMTSPSMDNGSKKTDNPFSVILIPLAFDSDLILELILTQSAVHRAAKILNDGDLVASNYYHRSLQVLRQDIIRAGDGEGQEALTLAVGALIMCFIETAKGDMNGTVFDHLLAARSLLSSLLSKSAGVHVSLLDFLVEYYVYTATLSLVSLDARVGPQSLISAELETFAHGLVAKSYVGSLCGCWLRLLLQIPTIFHLAHGILADDGNSPRVLTADDTMLFARVYSAIEAWQPDSSVSQDVATAGRIFQSALLIYLYTILDTSLPSANGCYAASRELAVNDAFIHFDQLAPDARINTSLCWPIVIIGTCIADEERRAVLRTRLRTMFATIGLGNIHKTSLLLERIWGTGGINPWSICHVMQENQIWISLA